ncbi:PREDICTED: protein LMBR1L isoform X2 [Myotis davidii]|uniref:protein LMBR1L isoform X2 n=1 Tax=Myotis davidii TaxID=225400 RepID=UPI000767B366|nr:PREDICTED: protein LMBR1L isoform X2 [Myotis davidii]XP_036155661.1 protein LMBR1L isoform X1 [Myotis myotis]
MEAADYEVLSVREQLFHERVRECIISTLLFATLYILCHITLTHFKKPAEFTTVLPHPGPETSVTAGTPGPVDDEDATVNKIALELCTFTLAVALGAVLLLPFSIISNEVLLSLPRNYYIQWLNGSLIHGLWNLVFLFSNLSLIFLMPFAYFFTESEGFAGSRKGVLGRVYETVVMLMLLTLLVLGMVWVASAIVDNNKTSRESLYDFWEYYLPYLYSCISFLGVLLLLVCTPLGLARMFSVTGKLLVKPRVLEDLEEQLYCSAFEEAALTRRICSELQFFPGGMIGMHWARAAPSSLPSDPTSCWLPLDMELLHRQVLALQTQRVLLEKRWKASAWQRNLGYPLAMLCLLLLTGLSVLIVAIHILELLIDEAAMPRGMQDASLGQVSFSKLGSFGAVIQVVLIFYLMVSSIVGFYSSPLFRGLRPRWHDTAMTQIIGNCVCLLVLSSALPVFSRTLGLTRFDLLGDFGRFNWLGNFYIVFLYNAIFAGLTTLCLVKTFTAAVRAELIRAFGLDRLPLPVSGFPRASRKTQHQ